MVTPSMDGILKDHLVVKYISTSFAPVLMRLRFVSLSLLLAFGVSQSSAITVTNLSCEDRANPLGVDVAQPRLGWTL